jgi:(p)ppGpp synthase/HD superfamily hydrolase
MGMNLFLDDARLVARTAHFGQFRKYTGKPYYTHCYEVEYIISRYAAYENVNDDILAAALLHDTVEDTHLTLEFIYEEFGENVGDLVNGLTDVSKPSDGNRAKRKEIDRKHIAKQSADCKTIKLADIISNTKSILEHDREFAKVYLKEKKLLLEVLKDGDANLYKMAEDIINRGLEEINGTD